MHQSVPSTPSLSVTLNSDKGWDSSYQVDSISALGSSSPQLDSGERTPVTASVMGGTTARRESVAVTPTSASTATSISQSPQRAGEEPLADSSYNFEDGNVTVQVEQSLFRVHEFKLKEFEELKAMLEEAQKDAEGRKTIYLVASSDDFRRMLAVLYSPTYERPAFTTGTLKAALRLATTHKHLTLRDYAVRNLEKRTLQPIERFALARDCGVSSWMGPALDDLCWREEPINVAEAQILGFEKFAELASRREAVKYERGSRLKLEMADDSSRVSMTPPLREPLPLPSATSTTTGSISSPSIILGDPVSSAPSSQSGDSPHPSGIVELGVPFVVGGSGGFRGFGGRGGRGSSTVRGGRGGERGGFRGFRGRARGPAAPGSMSQAETQESDSEEDV